MDTSHNLHKEKVSVPAPQLFTDVYYHNDDTIRYMKSKDVIDSLMKLINKSTYDSLGIELHSYPS